MKVHVNGEPFAFEAGVSLAALLAAYGAQGNRIAVTLNDEVIPRERRDATAVREGDCVEILTFAGGG